MTASKPKRRDGWLLWAGTFLLFASIAHGSFETTDAAFTTHAARALLHRGDSALLTHEEGAVLASESAGAMDIKFSEAANHRRNGKVGLNGHAYVWFPMGHVYGLVPFVALGEAVGALLPDADERLAARTTSYPRCALEAQPVAVQATICLLVPALCLATSLLLVFRIARELGAGSRDAVHSALVVGFATQAFALGREQLSDGPGLVLLLAMLLPFVRLHLGRATRWTALLAGAAAGAAVLMRYQTALVVLALAVALAARGVRRRDPRELLGFIAGGLPALAVFVTTNYLRFGDPLETGYPEIGAWFTASPLPGLAKLLFGAGRGVMWFSPLLWLALPAALASRSRVKLRWLAWFLFATPLLVFMFAQGWQGGRCWAARYVTGGVVGMLALTLPQTAPWRTSPRLWFVLVLAGIVVNLTSVVAPTRGQLQLASQAVSARDAHAVAAGHLAPDAVTIDYADLAGWHPRYTPLVTNWSYLARSLSDGFEDQRGAPRHGSVNALEPIYGVTATTPRQAQVPAHWVDRSGRHLWWRMWGDLYGVPGWLMWLPIWTIGLLGVVLGWRRLRRDDDPAPT
ncbi:MAG: glycosyltransferase family 39 protein [Polyangiaceae bacterium]